MPDSLRDWLRFLATDACPCEYAWKGLGILYGQSLGNGWVRMTSDPSCLRHAVTLGG